ncbi:MAG: porin family protein [Chitinispirillaceae bacterium]
MKIKTFTHGRLKSSALLLIITSIVFSAFGQEHFALGVKGGLNLSTLRGDQISELEENALVDAGGRLRGRVYSSYGGGLLFRWVFKENFLAIQTELLLNRAGKKWKCPSGDISLHTDYLSFPLLFVLMVPMDVLRPHISAGAVGMYALRSKAENVGWVSSESETFISNFSEADATDHVRRMDVGLMVGVGCDIAVARGAFVLDIRYQLGLMDVYMLDGGERIKNSAFSASTGYTLYF